MDYLDPVCHQLLHKSCNETIKLVSIPEISTTTYFLIVLAICVPPIIALVIYEKEQARLVAEQPKGCRKLGMKIKTNLANEFDRKFSEGRPPSIEETSAEWWRIKSMWIYPIKSCKGVELNRGTLGHAGMHYDRHFAFAQLKSPFPSDNTISEKEKPAHKWEIITRKQYPRLENLRTEMWIPDSSVDSFAPHAEDVESGGVIIVSFPWRNQGWRAKIANWGAALMGTVPEIQFRIPFDPSPVQIDREGYTYEKLTVWNHDITALNMEVKIPEELRYYLGISNKLGIFRTDSSKKHEICKSAIELENNTHSQPILGFQDAYPMHIVNLATIRDIESRMIKTEDTKRLHAAEFRANLIVTGPEPYHENCWRRIKIGFYEYDLVSRSSRYKPSDNDETSHVASDGKWNRMIRSYRTEEESPGLDVVSLGMQAIPLAEETAMRVGDEIVLQEIDAQYSFD